MKEKPRRLLERQQMDAVVEEHTEESLESDDIQFLQVMAAGIDDFGILLDG